MRTFLVDIYEKKTQKFIKRLILDEKDDNIKTELEAERYIKDVVLEDNQYHRIRRS